MSGHRTVAPCGTKTARNRHRRRGETCEACKPAPRPKQPCGTTAAYKRGCRCVDCRTANRDKQREIAATRAANKPPKPPKPAPTPRGPQPKQPCGTKAAYRRGCRCNPCVTASREYETQRRREQGITQRENPNNLIEEIEHLLMCGEGWHRILQATGCKPDALEQRLRRWGRTDLIPRALHMEKQMVWAA